jgi:hypothetical protein
MSFFAQDVKLLRIEESLLKSLLEQGREIVRFYPVRENLQLNAR